MKKEALKYMTLTEIGILILEIIAYAQSTYRAFYLLLELQQQLLIFQKYIYIQIFASIEFIVI